MSAYLTKSFADTVCGNSYVGRGIITGKSKSGLYAVCAYFIMGRSENSRNRIFALDNGELRTEPFDTAKVKDPSLIIYTAVKEYKNRLIITNGDQTDTIYEGLKANKSPAVALTARSFEPDAPNFTPRISSVLSFDREDFSYEMSILKSGDENGTVCNRFTYSYAPIPGLGHFIHTYSHDGNPIPSFTGEPERIFIPDDIEVFAEEIWDSLDTDNKISLYVRYTPVCGGQYKDILINKNK